ncbi:MAG: DNA polymerase III subunit gamma/tau [Bacteroides sp.]|nr:DNA polymerase III subunit gamma/tau [Ruminococcus flavefaciens]MCM1554588.1 DNA polymerase III subunit gamma/tau [Bacteroides sp.]
MEDFVVSARKYRPDTFDTVVGQQAITTTLKNSIKNGHLAQAFLFCGPRGVGKTTCARILARTINCMNPGADLEPCGECESCRGFKNNASQNIYELDAASNRTVDAMRALVEQVRIPPQVGKYKVYIIDEVHMLTSEAFNAFLKTLEEPPAYAKFILATTEKNKILPTILSRCQIFDFKRIGVEDIVNHLRSICQKESIACEDEALRVIAQKADGGLRDALSMFDQIVSFSGNSLSYKQVISMLNILDYETYFEMFGYFQNGDVPSCLNLFNKVLENGFDGHVFADGLSAHLRSLLLMQDAKTAELMESSPQLRDRYREQTSKCSIAQLLQALELCNQCDLQYRDSNNKRLLVEMLLLQLVRVFAPASLGARGGEAPASALGEPVAPPAKAAQAAEPQPPVSTQAVPQPPQPQASAQTPPQAQVQTPPVAPPAPASTPGENPQPAFRPVKGFTSLGSLKNLSMQAETAPVQASVVPEADRPVEKAAFTEVWNRYIESIREERPSLYSILAAAAPEANAEGMVLLQVANQSSKESMEKDAVEVLTFLRKELHNGRIEFRYHIDENRELAARPYTPGEKFMKMVENNPELKNFKESLKLDLEF